MAFFLGAPRVFAAGPHSGERVLQLEFDRTQKYLAVLTRSSLSVWSGNADRVLLAQHQRDDVGVDAQDGNVELIWSPGSTEIAVLVGDGSVIYYSLIKQPAYSLPVLLADPARADGVSVQLRHRAWADSHFLASASRDGRAIVCGTSDGQLVRMTWSGVVTELLTVTDGAKYIVATGDESRTAGGGYSTAAVQPRTLLGDLDSHLEAAMQSTALTSLAPAGRGPASAVGGGVLSAQDIAELERRVQEFYEAHNPGKLRTSPADFVQTTVEKWRGKEHLLLPSLHRKYAVPMPQAPADTAAPEEQLPVSKMSMVDIERSQPATLTLIRACTKIGVYACVRRDGGVFLVRHSHHSSADAASPEASSRLAAIRGEGAGGAGGAGSAGGAGRGQNRVERAVVVRTWIELGVGGAGGKAQVTGRRGTCVAWGRVYSETDAVVSVGYDDGTVACLLVKMPQHGPGGAGGASAGPSVTMSLLRSLDLGSAGIQGQGLSVACLSWDRGGDSVAALYASRSSAGGVTGLAPPCAVGGGCVLWSAFGGVTGSTLPKSDENDDCDGGALGVAGASGGPDGGGGEMGRGQTLAWSADGYRLVLAEEQACGRFVEMLLCRPRVDRGIEKGSAECLVLQAEDRILILRRASLGTRRQGGGDEEAEEEEREAAGARMGGESFDHILIPAEYFEAHGSVRLVAANASGDLIAVAAQCGGCVYNRRLGRWRMFGDVAQEKAFSCTAVRWWRNDALVLLTHPPVPGVFVQTRTRAVTRMYAPNTEHTCTHVHVG